MKWLIAKNHNEPTNEELGIKPISKRAALSLFGIGLGLFWGLVSMPWWAF